MLFDSIILSLIKKKNLTKKDVDEAKRMFASEHKRATIPSNSKLIRTYRKLLATGKIQAHHELERILTKRAVRSLSGIVPIQVLTKPRPCPGACIFCPNDPHMPKSYIKTEPGAMRAFLNNFDPIKQVYNRLFSLTITGHKTDKIEMIVLGGTRDVYPEEYKKNFVKGLYDACNTFDQFLENVFLPEEVEEMKEKDGVQKGEQKEEFSLIDFTTIDEKILGELKISDYQRQQYRFFVNEKNTIQYSETLEKSIEVNETSAHRIIGLTIETRPEYVSFATCKSWRELGVTRIEMGVQSAFNDVLAANKRGHTYEQVQQAVHTLRQRGFKFCLHMMPGLYTSTREKDIESFKKIFSDPYLRPDELKIYPTSVIPGTYLYELRKKGLYNPLTKEDIEYIAQEVIFNYIPPYTRIKRFIRDIPQPEIAAGSCITNLGQLLMEKRKKELGENPQKRIRLYARLYENYKIYENIEKRVENEKNERNNGETNFTTIFIHSTAKKLQDIVVPFETERNFVSLDTRSREIKNKKEKNHPEATFLIIRTYQSSGGKEYFIAYEDAFGYLYGFCRLLLPEKEQRFQENLAFPYGTKTALIRELHVYGQVQGIKKEKENGGEKKKEKEGEGGGVIIQHLGIGQCLLDTAEKVSNLLGYEKISVISGVGVREYYKKMGYERIGTEMVKNLK